MLPSARRVARSLERLTQQPFEQTNYAGLQELVDQLVPEGSQLDYKVDAYQPKQGSARDARDELRKDVVALANAAGGVLILGIADRDGSPTRIVGLSGELEKLEGHIRQTISSRVEPFLQGVEILPVPDPKDTTAGCLVVLVPASSRKPHAVRPMADDEALKFSRRVGRHTEWLSEAQVADLYRNRFADVRSDDDRMTATLQETKAHLSRRGWFILGTVLDEPGQFAVDRAATDAIYDWWIRRRRMDLFPNVPSYAVDAPSIGPQQVLLLGRDATNVPTGYRCAFYADGTTVVARQVEGPPGGNPTVYLDHLVAHVLEAVEISIGFAVELAGGGGLGLVRAELHMPEKPNVPIHAHDPSWSESATRLPASPTRVSVTHTIDIDASTDSSVELVAAAAVVAGSLAQHFGEADARYLTPSGAVRIQQFSPRDRDHHVKPKAHEFGLPLHDSVAMDET